MAREESEKWEYYESRQVQATTEWWKLSEITLNQLFLFVKNNPLSCVDKYTSARFKFLSSFGIPEVKLHALSKGRQRFHQLYYAAQQMQS